MRDILTICEAFQPGENMIPQCLSHSVIGHDCCHEYLERDAVRECRASKTDAFVFVQGDSPISASLNMPGRESRA